MISFSESHGATPSGKRVSTSFFVSLFILLFGLSSVLFAQSAPRGVSGGTSEILNGDSWEALGLDLDAPANAMVTVGDYLYVAGGFENANGSPAIRFARFNHTNDTWEGLMVRRVRSKRWLLTMVRSTSVDSSIM